MNEQQIRDKPLPPTSSFLTAGAEPDTVGALPDLTNQNQRNYAIDIDMVDGNADEMRDQTEPDAMSEPNTIFVNTNNTIDDNRQIKETQSNKQQQQHQQSPAKKRQDKFEKIFCHRQPKICRYTIEEIRQTAFQCIHEIAQTQMQIALIKDFLVDPFVDPETILVIFENGKVNIKDLDQIISEASIENFENGTNRTTKKGKNQYGKNMFISDSAMMLFQTPFRQLTKETFPPLKKFIDLIIQHSESEQTLQANGLLTPNYKQSISDSLGGDFQSFITGPMDEEPGSKGIRQPQPMSNGTLENDIQDAYMNQFCQSIVGRQSLISQHDQDEEAASRRTDSRIDQSKFDTAFLFGGWEDQPNDNDRDLEQQTEGASNDRQVVSQVSATGHGPVTPAQMSQGNEDALSLPDNSITSKTGMFGIFSQVVGDVRADKVYHDFKRAKRHISGTWAKKINTEEKLKEKQKQNQQQKLQSIQMQQQVLDSLFEKEDYENQTQSIKFIKKKAPINLHSSCLMLKVLKKLIYMLQEQLRASLMEGYRQKYISENFERSKTGTEEQKKKKKWNLSLFKELIHPLRENEINKIYVHISRICLCDQFIYEAMNAHLDDLFYQDATHPDWQLYQEITEETKIKDCSEDRMNKCFNQLQSLIALGNASYEGKVKGGNYLISQGFYSSMYASYYMMFNRQCKDRYELQSWKLNDTKQIFGFWNQLDDENLRDIYQLAFPPIKLNHLIYIPMSVCEQITLDNMDRLTPVKYGVWKQIVEADDFFEQVEEGDETDISSMLKKRALLNHKSEMYDEDHHIRVRVLSAHNLPVDFNKCEVSMVEQDTTSGLFKTSTYTGGIESVKSGISDWLSYGRAKARTLTQPSAGLDMSSANVPFENVKILNQDEQKNNQNLGIVILHFHGGGFVAQSSCSHQNYTRIWANKLGIPVLSVDYRLSPENPFPAALNDVWQVYYWLLEEGEKSLGMKINEVILAGDSAGGNLCCALSLVCIKRKYKMPLALCLSYPATYVGPKKFVPSLLLSLDDMLLPTKFLKSCLFAYGSSVANSHPHLSADHFDLLSPNLADMEDLKWFPPTLIQTCQNDPVRDYGILMALKLRKAGASKVVLKEHVNVPHGLLQMTSPVIELKQEAYTMIDQCTEFMAEQIEDHVNVRSRQ